MTDTLSQDDLLSILLHNRIFTGLLPGDMHKMLDACTLHSFAPGETIYSRHTPAKAGFFLLTGRVELQSQVIPGQTRANQIYTAGNPFGIEGLVKTWDRPETCVAVEASQALRLEGTTLSTLLDAADPAAFRLSDHIMEHFVEAVREANRTLHDLYVRPDRTLALLRELHSAQENN